MLSPEFFIWFIVRPTQANYAIHIYLINEIFNPMTDHVVNIVTLSTWQYVPETKINKSQNKSEKRWKIVNCMVITKESLYTLSKCTHIFTCSMVLICKYKNVMITLQKEQST